MGEMIGQLILLLASVAAGSNDNRLLFDFVNTAGVDRQKQAHVTTELISTIVFPPLYGHKPSPLIFDTHSHRQISPGHFERIINEGLSFSHQKFDRFFNGTPSEVNETKVAVVADASIPIMAGGRIAYFWGVLNLPGLNTSNCHEIYTANDDNVLNLCDAVSMKRCTRDATPILYEKDPRRASDPITKFLLPNGTPVRELAWLCTHASTCCEWECCLTREDGTKEDEKAAENREIVNNFFKILICSIIAILFCISPFLYMEYERIQMRNKERERLHSDGEIVLIPRNFAFAFEQMGLGDGTRTDPDEESDEEDDIV